MFSKRLREHLSRYRPNTSHFLASKKPPEAQMLQLLAVLEDMKQGFLRSFDDLMTKNDKKEFKRCALH